MLNKNLIQSYFQTTGQSRIFVTGTDTEVGKTHVSVVLLQLFNQLGFDTVGLKPIASGCEYVQGYSHLVNEDALALMAAMSEKLDYQDVNPIALKPAIAPHIAFKQAYPDLDLSLASIKTSCESVIVPFEARSQKPMTLIEGAGGWLVPLNDQENLSDLALSLKASVVLVVGLRLGCINHALLSELAILSQKGLYAGWITNEPKPYPEAQDCIDFLKTKMQGDYWGHVGYKNIHIS
jgi:dethiobiotin synthetase